MLGAVETNRVFLQNSSLSDVAKLLNLPLSIECSASGDDSLAYWTAPFAIDFENRCQVYLPCILACCALCVIDAC